MNIAEQLVPFPLFHGTSNHYVTAFKPGATPVAWPHKEMALSLLRDAWTALCVLGCEPSWYVQDVLNQVSGHSNWQHGELYLTPNRVSAVRYACGGAEYGGELLTLCRDAIDALAELDQTKAKHLMQSTGAMVDLLQGTGLPPILIEFDNVYMGDLSTERESDDLLESISFLVDEDERSREILGQQTNFRLANRRGIVTNVFEIEVECDSGPLPPFHLREIPSLEPWG